MHETSKEGVPVLQPIDQWTGKENNMGMYFMPKRNVDFMNNELAKAIRLNGKWAEYVSFRVRRVAGNF